MKIKNIPKNINFYLSLFLVTAFISNCRIKPEIIKPDSPRKSSAVVFHFFYNYQIPFNGYTEFDSVWIMKLEKTSKSYSDLNCIEANYKSDKRFYFLNIEPGQYTIVAGKFGYYRTQSKSPRYIFSMVFDKESREKMKFTVKESELINLGEFLMDESAVSFDQDPDLGRIGEKIFPGFKNNFGKNVQMTMAPGLYQALELPAIGKIFNHDVSPEKLEEIKNEVKEDFSGTEWKSLIK